MIGYAFFHPDHVVPSAEFISALIKFTNISVSQILVELSTFLVRYSSSIIGYAIQAFKFIIF